MLNPRNDTWLFGDQKETSLYRYFHEFYNEIVVVKRFPEESARIQHRLITLLERQQMDAEQRGGRQHAELYREVKYLMVALTDEIFLHLFDWEGRDVWRAQLLEVKVFNSQVAGQRIFENLEALLSNRDPTTLELARLYLIILFLGFQGKYRGTQDAQQLNDYHHYRRRLFFFITQRSPDGLHDHLHYDEKKRIFPDAYRVLELPYEKRKWLPSMFWWRVVFSMVAGIVLLVSIWVWYQATHSLESKAQQIWDNYGSEQR